MENRKRDCSFSGVSPLHGLTFLASDSFSFDEKLDLSLLEQISPFRPDNYSSLPILFTPHNCSDESEQQTIGSCLPPKLEPGELSSTCFSVFEPSLECGMSSEVNSQSQENSSHFIEPRTPPLSKKPVRVLKRLQYEDRPCYYLVEWERHYPGRVRISQQWLQGDKLTPDVAELMKRFEQKLANDPKLARELTEYELEAILDRTLSGEMLYLVSWIGWSEPSWEKSHFLLPKYEKILAEFERQNADLITKSSAQKNGKRTEKRSVATVSTTWGLTADFAMKAETDSGSRNWFSAVGSQHTNLNAPPKSAIATNNSNKNNLVVEAIRVVSKLDRGNSERGCSYLLEWPPCSRKTRTGASVENGFCSWEHQITLGNRNAIEKYERSLKRGARWAKQMVQFEVEGIERRRSKSESNIQYLVKWQGFEHRDWVDRNDLLTGCDILLKQFELSRIRKCKKGYSGRFPPEELQKAMITESLAGAFHKIGKNLSKKLKNARRMERMRKEKIYRSFRGKLKNMKK